METAAYLPEACRLFLLVAFVSAAWTKTVDIAGFSASLVDSFRVPPEFSKALAVTIASAEWIAVVLLFSGTWSRAGAGLALLLLVVFTTVVAGVLIGKRQAYCSCFGRSRYPVSAVDLIRNLLYILAGSFYLLHASLPMPVGLMTQLALLMVALPCFLISISLNEIRLVLR